MTASQTLLRTLRTRRRLGTIALATLALLLVWPLFYAYLMRTGHVDGFHHGDFGAYYIAALDWQAGESLYVEPYFGGWLYPPVYVLVFVPFLELAFDTASWVWTIGSILALWLALQALVAGFEIRLRWWERVVGLWALVGFHPLLYGSRLGQASIAIAAIVTLAFAAFEFERITDRRRYAHLSGLLTAIGGTVKLLYAPVGAHLVHDRRRFAGALFGGIVLAVVSLVVFGVDEHFGYLEMLSWGEDWGRDPLHPVAWFPGYYRPLYVVDALALPLRALGVSCIIALAWWTRDTGADRELFALGIVSIPVLGPQVSTHDLVVTLPAIIALLVIEHRRDGRPDLPIISLALFQLHIFGLRALVSLPAWVPLADYVIGWSPWLQPALWGNLILVGLAAYRTYEYRPLGIAQWPEEARLG
ncbi:MAG: glycosyltransferase family 87 protein [Halobacteriota archaeon]